MSGHGLRMAIWAAAALAIAGGIGWSLREQPVPVDLVTVDIAPLVVAVEAEGQTRIRDVYEVAAPVTGTAERSPVAVGDPVVAGQTVVAVIEPGEPGLLDRRSREEAEAAVREAETALKLAESRIRTVMADLAYTKAQADRARELVARGVGSQTALEDAELRFDIQKAALEAARLQEELARATLARSRTALIEPGGLIPANGGCCVEIRAPVSGRVLSLASVSRRPVTVGAPLLAIGDPARLEITADVLSADVVRVTEGAAALIARWGGDGDLAAVVRRVEPAAFTKVSALGIEEQRVPVLLDFTGPPEARSGLGERYGVTVRIVTWQGEVLQVPLSALFRQDGGWVVFVVEDGIARVRSVSIGHRNAAAAEVLSGLTRGDAVIAYPSDRVAEGRAVIPRDSPE